ncbi:uncharacterized protein I206_103286 [Kwoniella pini CBS 10737]|uniref:Uncharacterized protein n=1 Tax=Kwoniella pini CBS 10737 TaxID=1296096 RepID=A0A1B9IA01_9TREE|nr:uncharacterized protein I206_01708 [Kwoniella pini CBS 10737]OCF52418.1 hypothetical protein I206_01708 [Kwoniella pini CBS 10737]
MILALSFILLSVLLLGGSNIQASFIKKTNEKSNIGNVLAGGYINNITITTSNVIQCSEAIIKWKGTNGKVKLEIGKGGYYIGIENIQIINSISELNYNWKVNQPFETDLIFQITDENNQIGYLQNVKVQQSNDDSCLSNSSSSTSTSTSTSNSISASSSIGENEITSSVNQITSQTTSSFDVGSSSISSSKSKSKSRTSSSSSSSATSVTASMSIAVSTQSTAPSVISNTPISTSVNNLIASTSSSSASGSIAPLAAASNGNTSGADRVKYQVSTLIISFSGFISLIIGSMLY